MLLLQMLTHFKVGKQKLLFLNIVFWAQIRNLRKISLGSAPVARLEVLSASSYGWTKVGIEFRSQCRVFRLWKIIQKYYKHIKQKQQNVNIVFWAQIRNLRKISLGSAPVARLEVLSASSYGWTKVEVEVRSQCWY